MARPVAPPGHRRRRRRRRRRQRGGVLSRRSNRVVRSAVSDMSGARV